MTLPALPITAWEQAGIVALFALIFLSMIGGLLAWMDRQMSNIRKEQARQQEIWQKFIEVQEEKWRRFISDERAVYAGARKEDRDKLDVLATHMAKLAELLAQFREDFNEHVAGEDAKFDMMLDAKARTELAQRVIERRKKGQ